MKRILVADDDRNITAALSARLTSWGYEVITAANGFDALKVMVTQKPALALIDIWMPTGMGLSVAERLKSYAVDVPIIFMTASRLEGLKSAATGLGAAAYLEKPYDPRELRRTIQRTLGTATTGATANEENPGH